MISPNPFRTIWTSPRDTIARIVTEDPGSCVILLACLAGIGRALDRASMRSFGDKYPVEVTVLVACFVGPIGGILSLWLSSHLIRWTGRWIGGTASIRQIRAAIAWAAVPAVFALVLWIPELILFGNELFTSSTPRIDANDSLLALMVFFGVLEMVLGVWSVVLICHTIAEVQVFRSAWRGLLNIFLAGSAIVVLLALIVLLYVMLGKL